MERIFERYPIDVKPSALLAVAGLLLLSDWRTAAEIAGAVLLHEAGHLLAMRLCGVEPEAVTVGATGVEIRFGSTASYLQEAVIAAAGPLVSLLAALLASKGGAPLTGFAGANLLYCLLNLTPVSAADGGRILGAALFRLLGPERGWRVRLGIDLFFVIGLFAAGIYVFAESRGNITLILCALFLWKACCKREESGVQFFCQDNK